MVITAERAEDGKFLPGNRIGKGAVPHMREFRAWCTDIMSDQGKEKLLSAINDPKSPHHFRSLELVVNYAYGKPPQKLEHEMEPTQFLEILSTLTALDGTRFEQLGKMIDDAKYRVEGEDAVQGQGNTETSEQGDKET